MTFYYLVRHGETEWNREGKYTGQSDIPLNAVGRKQARDAAEQLKELKPDVIISSDLSRAQETARIIAQVIEVPIRVDKRLREIDQGEWEGLHVDEIKSRFNHLFHARKNNPLHVASPGGETIGEVHQRVTAAMLDICREYAHKKVVISAHGVVLAIMRITAQQAPIQQVFDFIPGNAVVHQIEITEGMI